MDQEEQLYGGLTADEFYDKYVAWHNESFNALEKFYADLIANPPEPDINYDVGFSRSMYGPALSKEKLLEAINKLGVNERAEFIRIITAGYDLGSRIIAEQSEELLVHTPQEIHDIMKRRRNKGPDEPSLN